MQAEAVKRRSRLEEDKVKRRKISNNIVVLSDDIIHNEILTRLPTKYILTCRLVCKSWYSLFSDPNFVKSHLVRQHEQEEADLIIVAKSDVLTYHGICIISRTQEIHVPYVPLFSRLFLGSINGLVCVSSPHGNQFCFWNPAIAQVKTIYLPSYHFNKNCRHSFVGFCWDHVRNDYKLVLVCNDCITFSPGCFLVYSSISTTWTQVPVISTHSVLPHSSVLSPPSALVKGIPYWTYSHKLHLPGQKRGRNFITTFKFVAECNEFRLLPDLNKTKICGKKHFSIVNIKDSLFGMAYKIRCVNSSVDIYSLDEESPSGVWSKMYTVGPLDLSCGHWELSQCFKNGGEILIYKSTRFGYYDPETKETKDIIKSDCDVFSNRTFSYTPSLVRVQGMELMKPLLMYGDSPP